MNHLIESQRPNIAIYFCGRYGPVYERQIDQNFTEQAVYYTPLDFWMMRIVSKRSVRVVTHELFAVETPDKFGTGIHGTPYVRWFDPEEFEFVEYRVKTRTKSDHQSEGV